ncbi:MAG: GNAT family N-acetyltransferase [Anaerolineae bacterium]|nr:GNAT family N-acetyltransferase [Anaerolineae bacterium]MDW8298640.1 GNAT family N-acetyltransferase [Anaerolineae bacterium]
MALTIDRLTTLEQLAAIQHEWSALLTRNAVNEVFLTWEWQDAWWRVYQPGELFVLTGRDAHGTLHGIAPWFIDTSNPEERVLRLIGCADVTDYLDIIAPHAQRDAFCAGIAAYLQAHSDAFSRINLCNIHGQSPTLVDLPSALERAGFQVTLRPQEVCPVIQLPDSFERYLESLDKKQRHEARRKLRRAESAEEKVAWYIVGPNHDIHAALETFLTLMAASHPNKAAFLQNEQNCAFFKLVVPRMAACGWLQLAFLTAGDVPIAAYLNFDYDNRILVYNSGLQPEGYAHLSGGIVLLLYLIQHAIECGRREFDFLRGNEEYKYRLGGQDRPVIEIQARLANR